MNRRIRRVHSCSHSYYANCLNICFSFTFFVFSYCFLCLRFRFNCILNNKKWLTSARLCLCLYLYSCLFIFSIWIYQVTMFVKAFLSHLSPTLFIIFSWIVFYCFHMFFFIFLDSIRVTLLCLWCDLCSVYLALNICICIFIDSLQLFSGFVIFVHCFLFLVAH